jgi:predicted ATP-dependent serine protease
MEITKTYTNFASSGLRKKPFVEWFASTLEEPINLEEAYNDFVSRYPDCDYRKGDFNHVIKNELKLQIEVKAPSVRNINFANRVLAQNSPSESNNIEFKMTRMEDEEAGMDPDMFVPMLTNTAVDKIFSKNGGVLKNTVIMVTGESGAGKTTICTNIGDMLKEVDPNIDPTFISGEMDKYDWMSECQDNPRLKKLNTVFLLDYLDADNYLEVLVTGLRSSKYVVVDSFEVILDQLKERYGWNGKKAESELINLLRQNCEGRCLMVIQQYTKSGSYVGSTKIKHLTTAMAYVMFDKQGERYLTFTKNRRGGAMVGKRLYFTKNSLTGRLEFDGTRFENEMQANVLVESEKATLLKEAEDFTTMLAEMQAEQEESSDDDGFLDGIGYDNDSREVA